MSTLTLVIFITIFIEIKILLFQKTIPALVPIFLIKLPATVKALSAQSYHVTTLGANATISLDIQNERAYHVIYHSKKDLANI